jgi:hypothetical protein
MHGRKEEKNSKGKKGNKIKEGTNKDKKKYCNKDGKKVGRKVSKRRMTNYCLHIRVK